MALSDRWRLPGTTLRQRLLLASIFGLIPFIIAGILLLANLYYTRRNLIMQDNLTNARLAATYIDGWLQGQLRTLRTLAGSKEALRGTAADKQGLVERQVRVQPDWASLFITSSSGQIIATTTAKRPYVGDRLYFQQAMATLQPVISAPLTSRATGKRVVVLAVPIIRAGAFQGIVAATITLERINAVFSRAEAGSGATISIWNRDYILIARTNTPAAMLGKRYPVTSREQLIPADRYGTAISRSPITEERVLIGYAPVEAAAWIIVSSTPYARAMAPVNRSIALFALFSFFALAIAIVASVVTANLFSAQVSQLVHGARAIGEGKLDTRIALHGPRELETLAESLNEMAADLAVIDNLKYNLITMVSHELRTPLTAILTALELLELPAEDAQGQELKGIAYRQSRRLQALVDNLINLARFEAGALEVSPRPVQLKPIVMRAAHTIEPRLLERNLQMTVEVPDDLLVMADAPEITLVLNNLLDNAAKFTEKGGITVRARAREKEAVITVTDTGVGFTEETHARLFEMFYQAEPLLTRRIGGAGLGLLTVKTVVEAHGGRVFAESAGPGRGSTFGFTLPLAPEAPG